MKLAKAASCLLCLASSASILLPICAANCEKFFSSMDLISSMGSFSVVRGRFFAGGLRCGEDDREEAADAAGVLAICLWGVFVVEC